MKYEDTICYHVNKSIDMIEKMVKTGKANPAELTHRLHKIRTQAQEMENGLKRRKEIMIKNNLENEYKNVKHDIDTPPSTNTLAGREERSQTDTVELEFIIKEKGEVVYQNTAKAGIFSIVERIDDIDNDGIIDGQTQKLFYGTDLAIWFAFDQLNQAMETKKVQIMMALKNAVMNNKFTDPDVKRQILEASKKINK